VLRYEKRTGQYGLKLLQDVNKETVDDALAASALLHARPEVDSRRVFLLGHSLGGYLAPRIAARDTALAGLVILAGNTRPLADLLLEQTEYHGARAHAAHADPAGPPVRAGKGEIHARRVPRARHVAPEVIGDIAGWILGQQPPRPVR
jgi:dienelactone hydrolase